MAAQRTASANWESDLLKGKGSFKLESSGLTQGPVSWAARTEAPGGKTSPEELLAAAHAACYAMAFTAALGRMGKPSERIHVKATATFDKVGEAWKVTTMDLHVTGKVPGMTGPEFQAAAEQGEKGCPISNAIRGNVTIKVTSKLE